MKIETIDVEATIKNTRKLLENDPGVSPALKGTIELLLTLVILMMNQLGLNSQNSSKPPSTDPNRKKKTKKDIPASPCKNLMTLTTSKISPSTENDSKREIQECGV